MSRPFALLALLAAPVFLAACDGGKSTLLSAKPGECYSIVGRDAAGIPKMAKVPCAGQTASLTCPPPAAAAASCPGVETGASGRQATGRKAVIHRASARRVVRRQASTSSYTRYEDRAAHSGEVFRSQEYARVDSDLPLGGAQGHGYAEGYEREEHYAPPPRSQTIYDHAAKSVEKRAYSYSESSRSSASSSSRYGSSYSYGESGRRDCDCDGRARVARPHSAYDAYGYLTWRGKTPG